jgi:hypothetical protein
MWVFARVFFLGFFFASIKFRSPLWQCQKSYTELIRITWEIDEIKFSADAFALYKDFGKNKTLVWAELTASI